MTCLSVANQPSACAISPCQFITLQCQADHRGGQLQTSSGSVESLRKRGPEFIWEFLSSIWNTGKWKPLEMFSIYTIFLSNCTLNSFILNDNAGTIEWRFKSVRFADCMLYSMDTGFIFTIYWFYTVYFAQLLSCLFLGESHKITSRSNEPQNFKKRKIRNEACNRNIKIF